jgi:hypothetical protein
LEKIIGQIRISNKKCEIKDMQDHKISTKSIFRKVERDQKERETQKLPFAISEREREGRRVFEFFIVKERETNFAVYLVSYFMRQFCKFSDYEKGNLVYFGSVSGFH